MLIFRHSSIMRNDGFSVKYIYEVLVYKCYLIIICSTSLNSWVVWQGNTNTLCVAIRICTFSGITMYPSLGRLFITSWICYARVVFTISFGVRTSSTELAIGSIALDASRVDLQATPWDFCFSISHYIVAIWGWWWKYLWFKEKSVSYNRYLWNLWIPICSILSTRIELIFKSWKTNVLYHWPRGTVIGFTLNSSSH